MKKLLLTLAAAATMTFAASAQDADPNRMLIISPSDSYKAFNIEHIKSIEFATVEGEVAANVTIKNHTMDQITVECMRTEACREFLFNVVPGVIARQLEENPSNAGSYLRTLNSPTYSEDFTNGEIKGMELQYNTEYAVVTVGIDMYSVEGDVRAAYFTTEKAPIIGDPKVSVDVTATDFTTIDLRITPNKDVQKYWLVYGEKGTLQSQYEQFAGMFGFSNIGDMVQAWSGKDYSGNMSFQMNGLSPNTEYELYVQTADVKGNLPEVQIFYFKTKSQGGSGEASVEILVGDFGLTEWDGVEKPTQLITYKPNDQTWAYRCGVYKADVYDESRETILQELASEPPMPSIAYWFFYETFTNEYQIDTNQTCVAVAVAKNADGKWGKPNEVRFTTPEVAEIPATPDAYKSVTITSRTGGPKVVKHPGFVTTNLHGISMTQKQF